jgi:hypothetical protein
VRLSTEGLVIDADALLSLLGLETIEDANLAAMSEERGAKWYMISGWRLELSLLSCGEGGESGR